MKADEKMRAGNIPEQIRLPFRKNPYIPSFRASRDTLPKTEMNAG